eukprot:1388121-Prymnesium_polylepis.2
MQICPAYKYWCAAAKRAAKSACTLAPTMRFGRPPAVAGRLTAAAPATATAGTMPGVGAAATATVAAVEAKPFEANDLNCLDCREAQGFRRLASFQEFRKSARRCG